jgi:thioredoxin-related protein
MIVYISFKKIFCYFAVLLQANPEIKEMKKSIIFILLSIIGISAYSQNVASSETSTVKWYTIQEAEKLNNQNPRPIFVDTYTDWCGWCKKMDKETFTNSVISDILNNKYYPVKFNAEGTDSVRFYGHTYINDGKAGKAHQFAVALLQGQLSYPTVVFIVPVQDGKIEARPVPGFRQPKEMEVILSYFADKAYNTQQFDDYQKSFKGKIQ